MELQYNNFQIKLSNDSSFSLDSNDNINDYKLIYSLEDQCLSSSKHGIIISTNEHPITSALVCGTGGSTTIHPTCCLISNNTLFICCGDSVYALNIPNLKLKWIQKLDAATCFEIYQFEDDLIIHGELEISRITQSGNLNWQFKGKDIFVNPNGKKEFEIIGNIIKVIDFEDNEYLLHSNGQLLNQS